MTLAYDQVVWCDVGMGWERTTVASIEQNNPMGTETFGETLWAIRCGTGWLWMPRKAIRTEEEHATHVLLC